MKVKLAATFAIFYFISLSPMLEYFRADYRNKCGEIISEEAEAISSMPDVGRSWPDIIGVAS